MTTQHDRLALREKTPFMVARLPEWRWLRSADMAVSASVGQDSAAQYPEELRTGGALYAQQYIHNGTKQDWESLTHHQTVDRLKPSDYMDLNRLSHKAMPDQDMYDAGMYINVVHDIAKNPDIMRAVGLIPGKDSHDEGLRRLFLPENEALLAEILPTYGDWHIFNDRQRRVIKGVLTTEFNFARFMQSQMSQGEIEALGTIDQDVLALAVMHGNHDIGGAMGHKQLTTSLTIDSPTATRMLDAVYALFGTAEDFNLEEGVVIMPVIRQAVYLDIRAHRLGIEQAELADVIAKMPEYVAQITIANLLKRNTPEEFAPVKEAYDRLPLLLRRPWADSQVLPLMVGPTENHSAYGMEYAPAFFRSLADMGDIDALYVGLGYFAQVLTCAIAFPVLGSLVTDERLLDAPQRHDQINFYHLAEWFRANGVERNETIGIIFEQSGHTLTPMPVDPATYEGPERVFQLLYPDRYNVAMLE